VNVPEAAMNHDRCTVFGEHKIGGAWQISSMKSVTETGGMQHLTNHQLRLGVSPSYPRHHLTAFRRIDNVDHAIAP